MAAVVSDTVLLSPKTKGLEQTDRGSAMVRVTPPPSRGERLITSMLGACALPKGVKGLRDEGRRAAEEHPVRWALASGLSDAEGITSLALDP